MRNDLRLDIERWKAGWFGFGTGLAIGGAVLTGLGIGLVTWGAVRLVRTKRRSGKMSFALPMVVLGRGEGRY